VLSEEFRSVLPTVESPYGDGTAGERIAELLAGVELGDRLLDKRVLSIDP
jgi:UDP-N-acetylglucosamine 2-epimerase